MQKITILVVHCLLVSILPRWGASETDVYIGLEARGRYLNLGLASFLPKNISIQEASLSRKVEGIVRYDLLFSLYFDLVEGGPIPSPSGEIDFESWMKMGTDTLITGQCEILNGMLLIRINLYDVQSGTQIWEQTFDGPVDKPRRIAHAISDDLIYRFTGEKGIALSRIAFSNNSTGFKEIYIVDYDGYNLTRLTNARSITLFPRWSPSGGTIMYTSYKDRNPDLFVVNVDGSGDKPLSVRQGLNTAAQWSPDGQYIALTLSLGKDPNIYLINTRGEIIRQITSARSAETSPDFSPNGNSIVYTSDRPGYPQLYLTDIFGRRKKRLFVGGYSDSSSWSPRGDKIAFTMLTGGRYFDIYTVDIFGRRQQRLTINNRNNENPSWSPDGRFIVFATKRNRKSELYIMSADGTHQHTLLTIKGESFMPDWSPYLNK